MLDKEYRGDYSTLSAVRSATLAYGNIRGKNEKLDNDLRIFAKRVYKLRGGNARYSSAPTKEKRKILLNYSDKLINQCNHLYNETKKYYDEVKLSDLSNREIRDIAYAYEKLNDTKQYIMTFQDEIYSKNKVRGISEYGWKKEVNSAEITKLGDMTYQIEDIQKNASRVPKATYESLRMMTADEINEAIKNDQNKMHLVDEDVEKITSIESRSEKLNYIRDNLMLSPSAKKAIASIKSQVNKLSEDFYSKVKDAVTEDALNNQIKELTKDVFEKITSLNEKYGDKNSRIEVLNDQMIDFMDTYEIEKETVVEHASTLKEHEINDKKFMESFKRNDLFGQYGKEPDEHRYDHLLGKDTSPKDEKAVSISKENDYEQMNLFDL